MKNYALKNSFGEVINQTKAISLSEAQEIFAIIKNLSLQELLSIFIVEEL